MRLLAAWLALAAGIGWPDCSFAQFTPRPLHPDPEAHDAIDLFSQICISTRGDRAEATGIIGTDNSAVERLDDTIITQLQNGKPGGIGWTVRMPLGEKLVVDFTPAGACVVRAPRVNGPALENALRELLDEVSASGQYKVHPTGDDEKTVDKLKYHLMSYGIILPGTGKTVEIGVVTTDAKTATIQGILTFEAPIGAR